MRALVTGASGFVGSHLVESLLREGTEVVALVRDRTKAERLEKLGARLFIGDLARAESLKGVGDGVHLVFHLAAQLNLPNVPASAYSSNLDGTRNLVTALRSSSIARFVAVSSIAAIGIRNVHQIDETFPCKPDLPYGESKLKADELVLDEWRRSRFPAVVVRPPTVYGPGERYNFLSLCRAIRSDRFLLIGSGENRMDFLWVGNLVQALVLAAKRGRTGETYLVADEPCLTFRQTCEVIASLVGSRLPRLNLPVPVAYGLAYPLAVLGRLARRSVPLYPKRVRTMSSDMCFDLTKAKAELGYRGEGLFRDNASRTVDWYMSEGIL